MNPTTLLEQKLEAIRTAREAERQRAEHERQQRREHRRKMYLRYAQQIRDQHIPQYLVDALNIFIRSEDDGVQFNWWYEFVYAEDRWTMRYIDLGPNQEPRFRIQPPSPLSYSSVLASQLEEYLLNQLVDYEEFRRRREAEMQQIAS